MPVIRLLMDGEMKIFAKDKIVVSVNEKRPLSAALGLIRERCFLSSMEGHALYRCRGNPPHPYEPFMPEDMKKLPAKLGLKQGDYILVKKEEGGITERREVKKEFKRMETLRVQDPDAFRKEMERKDQEQAQLDALNERQRQKEFDDDYDPDEDVAQAVIESDVVPAVVGLSMATLALMAQIHLEGLLNPSEGGAFAVVMAAVIAAAIPAYAYERGIARGLRRALKQPDPAAAWPNGAAWPAEQWQQPEQVPAALVPHAPAVGAVWLPHDSHYRWSGAAGAPEELQERMDSVLKRFIAMYEEKSGDLVDELLANLALPPDLTHDPILEPRPEHLRGQLPLQLLAKTAMATHKAHCADYPALNEAEMLVAKHAVAHGTDLDRLFGWSDAPLPTKDGDPPAPDPEWDEYTKRHAPQLPDQMRRTRNVPPLPLLCEAFSLAAAPPRVPPDEELEKFDLAGLTQLCEGCGVSEADRGADEGAARDALRAVRSRDTAAVDAAWAALRRWAKWAGLLVTMLAAPIPEQAAARGMAQLPAATVAAHKALKKGAALAWPAPCAVQPKKAAEGRLRHLYQEVTGGGFGGGLRKTSPTAASMRKPKKGEPPPPPVAPTVDEGELIKGRRKGLKKGDDKGNIMFTLKGVTSGLPYGPLCGYKHSADAVLATPLSAYEVTSTRSGPDDRGAECAWDMDLRFAFAARDDAFFDRVRADGAAAAERLRLVNRDPEALALVAVAQRVLGAIIGPMLQAAGWDETVTEISSALLTAAGAAAVVAAERAKAEAERAAAEREAQELAGRQQAERAGAEQEEAAGRHAVLTEEQQAFHRIRCDAAEALRALGEAAPVPEPEPEPEPPPPPPPPPVPPPAPAPCPAPAPVVQQVVQYVAGGGGDGEHGRQCLADHRRAMEEMERQRRELWGRLEAQQHEAREQDRDERLRWRLSFLADEERGERACCGAEEERERRLLQLRGSVSYAQAALAFERSERARRTAEIDGEKRRAQEAIAELERAAAARGPSAAGGGSEAERRAAAEREQLELRQKLEAASRERAALVCAEARRRAIAGIARAAEEHGPSLPRPDEDPCSPGPPPQQAVQSSCAAGAVLSWLGGVGLEGLLPVLTAHEVSLEAAADLQPADIAAMGIAGGDARRLAAAAASLRALGLPRPRGPRGGRARPGSGAGALTLRRILEAFYAKYDPPKVGQVPAILAAAEGGSGPSVATVFAAVAALYPISFPSPLRSSFAAVLERHCPELLPACDVLLDLYQGRERTVIAHIVGSSPPATAPPPASPPPPLSAPPPHTATVLPRAVRYAQTP